MRQAGATEPLTSEVIEIEITPEMIDAGVSAVDSRDFSEGLISHDEAVCLVYRAMEALRPSLSRAGHLKN